LRTYKYYKDNNQFFAFEIENVYIRPKKAAQLLSSVKGVADVTKTNSSEVHVTFKYKNKNFTVLEPYGDSSRYWIGPDDDDDPQNIDIMEIEKVFRNYKPNMLVKIIGDLISLNFRALFKNE